MKKVLVSFADKKYEGSQKNLTRSAMKNGIDWFENYTPDSLKYSIHDRQDIFYEKNKFILNQPRGSAGVREKVTESAEASRAPIFCREIGLSGIKDFKEKIPVYPVRSIVLLELS